MAMKAKLRVLLTKFSPLKKAPRKDGSITVITSGMIDDRDGHPEGLFGENFLQRLGRGAA